MPKCPNASQQEARLYRPEANQKARQREPSPSEFFTEGAKRKGKHIGDGNAGKGPHYVELPKMGQAGINDEET